MLEFGSPHGGTWIPLLTERGFTTVSSRVDVVLDCFGIMHEPDQRSAFARRAQVIRPDGVLLLLQYHSIGTIVGQGQWNALRHGHFAYYSLTTLTGAPSLCRWSSMDCRCTRGGVGLSPGSLDSSHVQHEFCGTQRSPGARRPSTGLSACERRTVSEQAVVPRYHTRVPPHWD